MPVIPGLTGSAAQITDGFTGSTQLASLRNERDLVLLSTANDVLYYAINVNRTLVLPSTDPGSGRTVKAGRAFTIRNSTNYDLSISSSNGQNIERENGSNQLATIRNGFVTLRALQDAPTTPAHWWVEEVREEGTFAPYIAGGYTGANPITNSAVFTNKRGFYSRNGRVVYAWVLVSWDVLTGGVGQLTVNFLPRLPTDEFTTFFPGAVRTQQVDVVTGNKGCVSLASPQNPELFFSENTDATAGNLLAATSAVGGSFPKTIEAALHYII